MKELKISFSNNRNTFFSKRDEVLNCDYFDTWELILPSKDENSELIICVSHNKFNKLLPFNSKDYYTESKFKNALLLNFDSETSVLYTNIIIMYYEITEEWLYNYKKYGYIYTRDGSVGRYLVSKIVLRTRIYNKFKKRVVLKIRCIKFFMDIMKNKMKTRAKSILDELD